MVSSARWHDRGPRGDTRGRYTPHQRLEGHTGMNSRLRFETQITVDDGYGGKTVAWAIHVEEFGEIEHIRSMTKEMEVLNAGGIAAEPVVRLKVDNNTNTRAITSGMRCVDLDNDVYMNIQSRPKDIQGDGQYLSITAREGQPS
ncbi:MAG: hypothetical protein CMM07_25855 [Rhodopirellula sp.]|nr:hypothetical protein [Rhodopirellula sp.]